MPAPGENKNAQPDLPLVNIDWVLDHEIFRSGLPGNVTEKYFIADQPDVLVRLNREVTPAMVHETIPVYQRLNEYGINVVPYKVIDHGDKSYVITQKVYGEDLQTLLDRKAPLDIQQLDEQWANLFKYMKDAKVNNLPRAHDVYSPHQYMIGKIAGEEEQKLWLVDIGEYTSPYEFGEYEEELVHVANEIVKMEASLGERLRQARESLELALQCASNKHYYGDAPMNMARHILNYSTVIEFDSEITDDHIEEFR